MKVTKTLHEIYNELTHLNKMRDMASNMLARAVVTNNQYHIDKATEEYKHLDEVIQYLSRIEVEYEDKYEAKEA